MSDLRNPGIPPPSALPLSDLEMAVLDERLFVDQPTHSRNYWAAPGRVARAVGVPKDRVLEIDAAARAKLRVARPIIDVSAGANGPLADVLSRLSRLEQLALIGVYELDDVRDEHALHSAEDDYYKVEGPGAGLPDHLRRYARILMMRVRERRRTGEEPSLAELELHRFTEIRSLIDLWGELVSLPAVDLSGDAYPTKLPLDRAEAHLRWLAGELRELRMRAAARLGRRIDDEETEDDEPAQSATPGVVVAFPRGRGASPGPCCSA